jgi:hypothetical protein
MTLSAAAARPAARPAGSPPPAALAAPVTPASPEAGTGAPPPAGDRFERAAARPTTPRPTAAQGQPAPRGDAALGQQLAAARATAHAGGVGRRAAAPQVRDGAATDRIRGASADTHAQQTAFEGEMRAAGVDACHPPTQDQLRAYFRTFDSRARRGEAPAAYERYARAFHTHTANVPGRRDADVRYSPETSYVVGNRFYGSEAEAARRGDYRVVDTADASAWGDVNRQPLHEGRRVQDCEGFAFMAQDLLGAAGYRTEQVANQGSNGYAHAMVAARDPQSGRRVVVSNERAFSGTGSRDALLGQGWNHATGNDGSTPGRFYTGETQAQAQARLAIALDP